MAVETDRAANNLSVVLLLCSLGVVIRRLLLVEAPSLWLRLLAALLGLLLFYAIRYSFRKPKASTHHGSAGFATHDEMESLLVAGDALLPTGSILLGRLGKERVVLSPPFTGQHGIIVGGSGTGKSYSFFLPNVAANTDLSCVATDPKSELWKYTSGLHRCATRFAPSEPEASTCLNWIPLCRDARIAELCARAIVEAGATERQEPPWPDLESAMLAALFAHASTLPIPTPLTAYQLLTRLEPQKLLDTFMVSQSPVVREQAIIFQQTNERMRGSIVPVVASKLQWLRDPRVERFTSASLAAPDFGRLRFSPEAIYWCVREQDMVRLRPLSSLFFTLLLEQLANERIALEAAHPVNLYLDELPNVGIIPRFPTTISLARGRGVHLWLGIQSLSQLEACYGKPDAQTILTNCACKMALSGLDIETAQYFSRSLGEKTEVAPRRTWQKKRFALFAHGRSDALQEHRRSLLTPDEVRRIDSDELLLISGNKRPMRISKTIYDAVPRMAQTTPLGEARTMAMDFPMPTPAKASKTMPPPLPKVAKPSQTMKRTGRLFSEKQRPRRGQVTWVSKPEPPAK